MRLIKLFVPLLAISILFLLTPLVSGQGELPQDISTSVGIALEVKFPDQSTFGASGGTTVYITAGQTLTLSGTLDPMIAGTITIEQSEDAVTWLTISSGSATNTVVTQFKIDNPGTYFVRAKYDGYNDTAVNKHYLPSQSAPITLKVSEEEQITKAEKPWLIPLAIALGIIAAGAIGFFISRRLRRAKAK